MKACSNPECESKGELLPLNRFHKRIQSKDGRTGVCSKCINKRNQMRKDGLIPPKPKFKSKEQIKREIALAKKIYCDKMKRKINKDDCVPGCNDICIPCPNKQMQNVRASDDTLSPEEEREMRHEGAYQSHMVEAMEGGYIDQ